MKDRHIKYPKYEAEGVPYYLIVDTETRTVEIYQLINGQYIRQPPDQNRPYEFGLDECRVPVTFDRIWE